MGSKKSEFFFSPSIKDLNQLEWNACIQDDHPFLSYEFLSALEKSNSVSNETGWIPHHYVEFDKNNKLIAACPIYIKSHSFGEYIFDHSWADAYNRYGIDYYPKLQSAIPFTPVTGERIIINKSIKDKKSKSLEILNNIINEAKRIDVSSLHFNFISKPNNWLHKKNIMIRQGIQFHWKNHNYKSFDDFLKTLSSRKRKQIKKERLCLKNNNLKVVILTGNEIKEEHIDFFYECYLNTTGKKWGSPYLNKNFFREIMNSFNKKTLLFIAFKDKTMVASAINFFSNTHLYGRLWGSKLEVPFLHFELCYYQAINFAIENKIQTVEAGAQGEHKLQRGYMPKKTWSAHWIKDEKFSKAIENFLNEEKNMINSYKKDLEKFTPYKSFN